MEYASLQSSIASAERLMQSAPGPNILLANFVENAKSRVGFIERKIKESQEKETRAEEQAKAFVALRQDAERETALSESERQTYDRFLSEDFFTRKDFSRLDQFYSHSWDRLSQHGKDEMSHRVWEGVRQGNYTFGQLPPSVKEKETKQAYDLFRNGSAADHNLSQIPASDRNDFIRAYEAGKTEEASKIIERPCFRDNLFRDTKSEIKKHASAEQAYGADRNNLRSQITTNAVAPAPVNETEGPAGKGDLAIPALNLKGMELADAPAQISAANIPNAKEVAGGGPSVGGG